MVVLGGELGYRVIDNSDFHSLPRSRPLRCILRHGHLPVLNNECGFAHVAYSILKARQIRTIFCPKRLEIIAVYRVELKLLTQIKEKIFGMPKQSARFCEC